VCEAEGIDPGDATLRADFINAIEANRAAGTAGKTQGDADADATVGADSED
jgi:hypothetical protein